MTTTESNSKSNGYGWTLGQTVALYSFGIFVILLVYTFVLTMMGKPIPFLGG